jgi:hypothetical protein
VAEAGRGDDWYAICAMFARYARGIDRLDRSLIESAYWPDAIDNHPGFSGSRDDFIDYALECLASRWDRTMHILGQSLVEFFGSKAGAETYFTAYHFKRSDEQERCEIWAGRYVDQLVQRAGDWRILHRNVIIDWNTTDTIHERRSKKILVGCRSRDDRSYSGCASVTGIGIEPPNPHIAGSRDVRN